MLSLEPYTAFWLIHRGYLQLTCSHYHLVGLTVKVSKEMEIISKKEIGEKRERRREKD